MSLKAPLEIGKTYDINHSRFGRATVRILGVEGEWISTEVVSGVLRGMTEEWFPGDEKTVRLAHCTFTPISPPHE